MEQGDNKTVQALIRDYKLQNGAANYPALFNIPSTYRIPELAKADFERVNMLIIGALTVCFEGMNLKRGMNEIQILSLSEHIIESAHEDNLSIEDLVLFLQNMIVGKYELSYESMDIPKFMRIFEIYREERHQSINDYRYNLHLHHAGLGDGNKTAKSDPISEHFSRLGNTLSELRTSLRETRKENNTMKQAERFYGNKE